MIGQCLLKPEGVIGFDAVSHGLVLAAFVRRIVVALDVAAQVRLHRAGEVLGEDFPLAVAGPDDASAKVDPLLLGIVLIQLMPRDRPSDVLADDDLDGPDGRAATAGGRKIQSAFRRRLDATGDQFGRYRVPDGLGEGLMEWVPRVGGRMQGHGELRVNTDLSGG